MAYSTYGTRLAPIAKALKQDNCRIWVIGDSKCDPSRQPNIAEMIERHWPLNFNGTYVSSRNGSPFTVNGRGCTFNPGAVAGLARTDKDIGASFALGTLGTNDFPVNAAEITFSANVADGSDIIRQFAMYNGAWATYTPPLMRWRNGDWTQGALSVRNLFIKHQGGPAQIVNGFGRSTSPAVGSAYSHNFAVPYTGYSDASLAAAGAYASTDYPVAGYRTNTGYDETGTTLVSLGAVFSRTVTSTNQARVIPTGQSGMKTVEWLEQGSADATAIGASAAFVNNVQCGDFLNAAFGGLGPNIIFIQLGANHWTGTNPEYGGGLFLAYHTTYLRNIINNARAIAATALNPNPLICLLTDFAQNGNTTAGTDEADSRQARTIAAADAEGVAVMDIRALVKATCTDLEFHHLCTTDGLHANAAGQEYLGQAMWSVIEDTYTENQPRGGFGAGFGAGLILARKQ